MAQPLLEMRDIVKYFGPVQALKGVQLDLYPGEVLALMGENGAGKSTLMNILCGAIQNYSGEIRLNGTPVQLQGPLSARKHGIAKIHQELQLVSEMTVAENIFLGREICNRFGAVDRRAMEAKAAEYLQMLELSVPPSRKLKDLRVGEQQLVEIAKALSLNARILIMDEPTSAISKAESEVLFRVIERLTADGVGIIYITHRMEEVSRLADRLTVFRDGTYVATCDAKTTSRDEIIALMVGRKLEDQFPKVTATMGEEVLRVEDLCFRPFAGSYKRPIEHISLQVRRGEVLGIAGLMGAGRSEFFECLFGMHPGATTGSIYVDGKEVHIQRPADAIAAGLAFATEDRKGTGLVLQRSIGENMSLPLLRKFSPRFFMRQSAEKVEWRQQMQAMRIKAPSYATMAGNLSGGNQQKVVLGRRQTHIISSSFARHKPTWI